MTKFGGVVVLGVPIWLAACALPPASAPARVAAGWEEPPTGSLIPGGAPSETVGRTPDAGFESPQSGIGSVGYIAPGSSR